MIKSRKMLASVLTSCVLAAGLATNAMADNAKKTHIDVIAKGFQHQFWKAVELGSNKAAKELGIEVTFQGPDTESNIAQQLEYLNTAIAGKPDAICLAALDTNASLGAISEAQDEGIPIIGFDSGVPNAPEGAIKANASTDNYAAGALAATELFKLIEPKIKAAKEPVRIGVVTQDWNGESVKSRTKGFVDEVVKLVGKNNVSIEGHDALRNENDKAKVIVDIGIPAEVKDVDAAAVASALLEKEDLIAIYGSNEFAANAIITANEGLEKIGKGKVVAVGFDAGKKQLDAVRAGLFAGSITQDPVQIGYKAVKLAYDASHGKAVKDVDTGAKWYNSTNMDDADIKPCLYE
ncbi:MULTISPECIES: ABC transporter substrate-binding protein [Pasteurellaceae]|uniref:ABC transporter substrate-binding protein n=4 Tax=Pasteurellaceae TaxID=712 RepID=A0A1H7UL71_9PAST|nr:MULTISPECIES: ABC transporter substrate-binding protein [Pasteurella]MBR0574398.1 ABC transporter substrate-binding protein [Pasteurella atlantica]MDP8040302.1 ABC transporter substrate-binding protein [Pasteurella atlantica]MDP8042442.1 ABC transporter substrate-binding protein [Pasteurella atlantica]MDP8044291.1 ABC transporter substrate-binding protein [Pasteurella atlantica]MDP8046620.1 ABC transporter substrate-binding protein [Pasteurella atlantica]